MRGNFGNESVEAVALSGLGSGCARQKSSDIFRAPGRQRRNCRVSRTSRQRPRYCTEQDSRGQSGLRRLVFRWSDTCCPGLAARQFTLAVFAVSSRRLCLSHLACRDGPHGAETTLVRERPSRNRRRASRRVVSGTKSESGAIVRCSKNCRAIEQSTEGPLRAFAQAPRLLQVEMAVLAGLCEGVRAYLLLQCC